MAKTIDTDLRAVNLIAHSTNVVGDIVTEYDIRIDGELKGNLVTKGRFVLGKTGTVTGDIKAKNAEIEGFLNGTITVIELLSLKASSKFEGDIVTSQLFIEPGANFSGSCKMNNQAKA